MLDGRQRWRDTGAAHDRAAAEHTSTENVDEEDVAMVTLQSVGSATDQRPVSLVGWTGGIMIGAVIWLGIFAIAL